MLQSYLKHFLVGVVACLTQSTSFGQTPDVVAVQQQLAERLQHGNLPSPPLVRLRIEEDLAQNALLAETVFGFLSDVEDDPATTALFQSQLEQLEGHNHYLQEQLEKIDRDEFVARQFHAKQSQLKTLQARSIRLRASQRQLDAIRLEARAAVLRNSLADGSWQAKTERDWRLQREGNDRSELIVLRDEVDGLREQAEFLRQEVQALRDLLQRVLNRP